MTPLSQPSIQLTQQHKFLSYHAELALLFEQCARLQIKGRRPFFVTCLRCINKVKRHSCEIPETDQKIEYRCLIRLGTLPTRTGNQTRILQEKQPPLKTHTHVKIKLHVFIKFSGQRSVIVPCEEFWNQNFEFQCSPSTFDVFYCPSHTQSSVLLVLQLKEPLFGTAQEKYVEIKLTQKVI